MKTSKNLVLIFLFGLFQLSFVSCSGDDDGGSGGSAALGTITAKVDGANFSSISMATFATKQVVGSGTTFIIQGNDASGKAIQIILNGTDGNAGTFQISNSSIANVASYTETNISNPANSQVWAAPYENSGNIGSVTITEVTSTNIKGNFSFTGRLQGGTSLKQITEGAFNINFQ